MPDAHVDEKACEGDARVRGEAEGSAGLHLRRDLQEVLWRGRAAGLLGGGAHEATAVPHEARTAEKGVPGAPCVFEHHPAPTCIAWDRGGHRVQ